MKPPVHTLATGLVATLLTACQPSPSTAESGAVDTSPTASTIPEPMPSTMPVPDSVASDGGTDAVQVADATSPADDPGFDPRAFAGRYAGAGQTLDVEADGGFRLATDGGSAADGTWSLEADGVHVLLDPDAKSEHDRRFALHADGSLHQVGGDAVLVRAAD